MATESYIESELYTPAEAAREVRRSVDTVKRWVRNGQLDVVTLPSGRWLIAADDLRAMRTRRRVRGHRQRDESVRTGEPS